ncbi:hypothetical protein ACJMK2_012448 [Sinanodonta woodiana]|uniref:L-serine ammonia-lyase n=1 Tax=Sinanodonta woodiana TaxID=1069815 RepID=A0ABD3V8A3_SINWO
MSSGDPLPNGTTSERKLYLETPTIHSGPISKVSGFDVFLKLENLQIPGSFKIRGISNLCKKALVKGKQQIVCASGGNAGLAAAYCAQQMNITAKIILPESTPGFIADKLRDLGAQVEVVGKVFDESNVYALKLGEDPAVEYVHPFDHPDLWEGHSTIMDEVARQMSCRPDVVIVSVGGGGLLNGVLIGMKKIGWSDVPCVAMETIGADCLNKALKAGKPVTLPDITSVAKCLGALTVCSTTLDYIRNFQHFHSCVVDDRQAVDACLRFSDDHRMLVEPACGASLAAVYGDTIKTLQNEGKLGPIKSALVIVCGGSSVTLSALEKWRHDFNL